MRSTNDFRFPPYGTPYMGGGSHLPALMAAFAATNGPVLECGCGTMSTPVLHALCAGAARPLTSLDTAPAWLEPVAAVYATSWHRFLLVDKWPSFIRGTLGDSRWGLVFVDQDPAIDRADSVRYFLDRADIVVVHDTEPDRKERGEERMWVQPLKDAMATASFRANFSWGSDRNDVSILSNRRPVNFDLPFGYVEPGT